MESSPREIAGCTLANSSTNKSGDAALALYRGSFTSGISLCASPPNRVRCPELSLRSAETDSVEWFSSGLFEFTQFLMRPAPSSDPHGAGVWQRTLGPWLDFSGRGLDGWLCRLPGLQVDLERDSNAIRARLASDSGSFLADNVFRLPGYLYGFPREHGCARFGSERPCVHLAAATLGGISCRRDRRSQVQRMFHRGRLSPCCYC